MLKGNSMQIIMSIFTIFVLLFSFNSVFAQEIRFKSAKGQIIIPESSIPKSKNAGRRMHTNYIIYKPNKKNLADSPTGETPASMACIYGLTPAVPGCPIDSTAILPTGGWGTIALVDAYDNPNAESDLNVFSAQFGLPACTTANGCFQKVYAGGTQPAYDSGWAIEEALDIEWAHAMAPNAKIILVEAASDSNEDLFFAEDVATALVQAGGGGNVSNSWGESEYPGETSNDSHFQGSGIVYLASSGDSAAPANYPASSPYVVAAGGTSIIRSNGLFVNETAWSLNPARGWGGSGGPSIYESRPQFQNSVQKIVGTQRGTPDISFNANPESGVAVYSTDGGGWMVVGGTSVSSPSLAGIINVANSRATSTAEELNIIYQGALKNYPSYWHNIREGNNGFPALSGYDFVTGLGSPLGYVGK